MRQRHYPDLNPLPPAAIERNCSVDRRRLFDGARRRDARAQRNLLTHPDPYPHDGCAGRCCANSRTATGPRKQDRVENGTGDIDAPTFVVIAGPNGSGKTTFSRHYRENGVDIIDPDRIALENAASPVRAGRLALTEMHRRLSARESFGVESTIAGKSMLATIRNAFQSGYRVELAFIATDSPDINVQRIAERVARGGHTIPEDDIRRRYPRSIAHGAVIASYAPYVLINDNSHEYPETCITYDGGDLRIERIPPWAENIARALEARVTERARFRDRN